MDSQESSLIGIFHAQADRFGPCTALRYKRAGLYSDLSWQRYRQMVDHAAYGWMGLGIQRGDRIALLSENRYEWLAADLSILAVGAADVSIHAPLTAPQVAYQLADSGARWVVVSSAEQLAKVCEVHAQLPALEGIVAFDSVSAPDRAPKVLTWNGLVMRGRQTAAEFGPKQRELERVLGADDLAALMYTSGTTGEPKGVMLTHGNLVSNATATYQALPPGRHDVLMSWLPYSHIYARLCDHYLSILSGCVVALSEGLEHLVTNLKEVQPTHMTGVPRFYEKVWESVEQYPDEERSRRLKDIFGPRIKWLSAGGAPLPTHVAEGFWKYGLKLLQGYGLTESSPVITFNTTENNRIGTIGRAISGVEVKIAEDGEILSRGPHIMKGYWKKPEATAEAIDSDGWLHTGDLGAIDGDGYVTITGRKKDLIVLSNGKKVAPALIESLLLADELIDQAVVHGDRRRFLSALIVPNFARLAEHARTLGIQASSARELVAHPEISRLIDDRVQTRLGCVSPQERVKRFVLLDRAFTLADDELTTTLKYRRQVIFGKHQQAIDALYADVGPTSDGEPG
jgi:long-chain acyl-CoA synthetase